MIVGGGPAGLAAACRLGQLAAREGRALEVCVLEKGAEIGAHTVSGAVLDPRALDELFPQWRALDAPIRSPVVEDSLVWLTGATRARRVPDVLVPHSLRNPGCYVVSLADVCRWLAAQAEALGVHILPAQAAVELLHDEDRRRIVGVATGPHGVARDGRALADFDPGYEILAQHVILAEGARGSLTERCIDEFQLRRDCDPPHYALGLKEIWEVPPDRLPGGFVQHTLGWPLGREAGGGGFVYHGADGIVSVGLLVDLSYRNPHLDPFCEFQQWKTHPSIRAAIEGGQRIGFAARTVSKGGYPSLSGVELPGLSIVGCAAGLLNPARIKGSHTAMKSGMLAAEAAFEALDGASAPGFTARLRDSWVWKELEQSRHFAPAVARFGAGVGGALAWLEQNLLRRPLPLSDLRNGRPDHTMLEDADAAVPRQYPAPDGVVTFDRPSSVYLANLAHREDQPVHLELADADVPIAENLPRYDEPAQRYCPAGVYEVLRQDGAPRLQINAANCLHCKACDVKDPAGNIRWVPPEGGSGPNYGRM